MIRLHRTRVVADLPPDFTGKKLAGKLLKLVQIRHRDGDDIKFSGVIGDWKKAKSALERDSLNKCAYCESDTKKVAHGDVEHFRPKSKYWWLALCLDNYVYSCQLCNQSYKSDSFPIKGNALKSPRLPAVLPTDLSKIAELIARISPDPALVDDKALLSKWFKEDSDLPNPYLEDPEPLFAWKVSATNAEVHLVPAVGASPRARRAVKAATDFLGLNRETLTRSRFLIYKQLEFAMASWEKLAEEDKHLAEQQVYELCAAKQQYAGMSRYFARAAGFIL